MIAVDVYRTLGQNLEEIAQDWDHDSLVAHSPEKVGDIEYCHQVAMVAFQLAVLRNDSLPLSWLSVQGGAAKNGVSIFATMSYMKAATAGYNGMARSELDAYVLSDDALRYAVQVASGPGLASVRTRTEFGMLVEPRSAQLDCMIKNGSISIKDDRLAIPGFDGTYHMHLERAEEKGLDMTKRCMAMQKGAFKPIFRAINLLSINSGAAAETYEKFAAMR